jgi:hypothetical protein
MKSFFQAYEAYEKRVIRGEFQNFPRKSRRITKHHEPLMARLGNFLIHAGIKLKRRSLAGKPMVWTPMTGSKP